MRDQEQGAAGHVVMGRGGRQIEPGSDRAHGASASSGAADAVLRFHDAVQRGDRSGALAVYGRRVS
jgi:hypothetical protein